MQVDHQIFVHIQEFRQHLVCQLRGQDLQVAHRPQRAAHLEILPAFENKAGRCHEILRGQPRLQQLVILEGEGHRLFRIEGLVQDLQALHAVQWVSPHPEYLEVIQDIRLDPVQLRPRLVNVVGLDRERDILRAHQPVVAPGKLVLQHLGVFHTYIVKFIVLRLDPDHLLEFRQVGLMVDKRQLEINRAVKIIEEITPVLENGTFILILCQLIVDVIEANGLGIQAVLYPADPIPPHLAVGDGFLGGDPLFLFLLL